MGQSVLIISSLLGTLKNVSTLGPGCDPSDLSKTEVSDKRRIRVSSTPFREDLHSRDFALRI